MRTIHFINGTSIEVNQSVVDRIAERSINSSPLTPASDIQWFKIGSDQYNLMIKYSQISYID